MKKSLSFLASLMAITLLSCSSVDNPISSAEDVNYQQEQVLQKVSPVDIIPYAATSRTISCSSTMSVSNIPYLQYAYSSEVSCNFTSIPSGSTITNYEFTSSVVIGAVGAFTISNFIIKCGSYSDTIAWNGWSPTIYMPTPSNLIGKPANVTCKVSFYGRCNGTGSGGVGCSQSRNNATMTMHYQ